MHRQKYMYISVSRQIDKPCTEKGLAYETTVHIVYTVQVFLLYILWCNYITLLQCVHHIYTCT